MVRWMNRDWNAKEENRTANERLNLHSVPHGLMIIIKVGGVPTTYLCRSCANREESSGCLIAQRTHSQLDRHAEFPSEQMFSWCVRHFWWLCIPGDA